MKRKFEERYEERFRELGLKIAYLRKRKGYTQEFLCSKMNMSLAFYSQIEARGMYKPISLITLFRIADALQVDPSKLLVIEDIST